MVMVRQRVIALLVIASLSSCALNAVRIEGANQVTLAANSVVSQANATLDDVKARRQRALLSFIVSDPNCPPVGEVYVFVPQGPPTPGAKLPPLCATGQDAQFPGYRAKLLHFTAISSDRLKPTVLLIASVAEYAGAIKAITDRPQVNVSKIIASAAQKASDARTLAESVSPVTLPAIPNLETKQATTAIALLQMFAELAQESEKVKDIKSVYAKHSADIDQILDNLKQQVLDWNNATNLSYAEIDTGSLRRAYKNENERTTMNFEGRRAFLELIQQSEKEKTGVQRVSGTFAEAIDALREANTSLGTLLAGKNLTAEQKAREAQINEERILKALKLTVSAATTWGVL